MRIFEKEFESLHVDDRSSFYLDINNNVTRRLSVILDCSEFNDAKKLKLLNILNDFQYKCLLWSQYCNSRNTNPIILPKNKIIQTAFPRKSIKDFQLENDYSNKAFCLLVNSLCSNNPELNGLFSWVFWKSGRTYSVFFEDVSIGFL